MKYLFFLVSFFGISYVWSTVHFSSGRSTHPTVRWSPHRRLQRGRRCCLSDRRLQLLQMLHLLLATKRGRRIRGPRRHPLTVVMAAAPPFVLASTAQLCPRRRRHVRMHLQLRAHVRRSVARMRIPMTVVVMGLMVWMKLVLLLVLIVHGRLHHVRPVGQMSMRVLLVLVMLRLGRTPGALHLIHLRGNGNAS